MSAERLDTPGIISRRSAACDRCRCHKAKCTRELPSQTRCGRCLEDNVECVNTWPMSNTRNFSGEYAFHKDRVHKRPRQESNQQRGILTPSSTSSITSGPTRFEWLNPSLPAMSNAIGDVTGDGNTTLYGSMGFNELKQPLDHFNSSMDLPGELLIRETIPTPSQSTLPSASFYPTYIEGLHNTVHLPPTYYGNVDFSPDVQSGVTNSVPVELNETPMQRLSNIEYKLITLLGRLDKGSPNVTLATLVSPIDGSRPSVIDDILNSTREYINVLEVMAGTCFSFSAVSMTPEPRGFNFSSHARQNSDWSSTSGVNSSVSADTISSIMPSRPPSLNAHGGLKFDTPSLLLILTTYIYILRLYLIISAHICEYMIEVSRSDDPTLCPIPGLSFSNFPIRKATQSLSAALFKY
ncbi:Pyrimidine pathway regulatory protein 1 [Cytospora mali]|uniref:Pyrimidine pathway regulatory protein 1 n=1 Tax=Cytospora mali TaxID=578113 RepID=A0A194UV82_CYTMA|nr:Pyrimidine pathway regulatory protein 1 [Valsa mali var. pyri (nom. inval.)]